jgi:hypothetical protein
MQGIGREIEEETKEEREEGDKNRERALRCELLDLSF